MKMARFRFGHQKMEPAPRWGVWLGRRHHGSDRAFFHRDGSQRIYRVDCEHRLAGGQVERGREDSGAPSRQSPPLDVLLRWGDPAGIIIDAVERSFIGLAIVSLVSLIVTRGTPGVAVGSDQQPQKGTQGILSSR
jgi:hypothetical protein